MALPVRVVASGGLPVQLSLTAFGMPVEISTLPGALPVQIVLTGGVPCLDVLGGVFASLTAPVLTWVSADTDNTPLFEGVFTDLQENDVGRLQISTDAGFTAPTEITNTADAAEVLALQLDYTSGALINAQYWVRVRHERGASVSAWSNVETKTIAVAVPVLSSPVDNATGQTTGSGTVTTDIGSGTLYFVVSTSSTAPSVAQIVAGQMHTGAAAADSGSQAVSGTGVQTITGGFAGLTLGTGYFAHYVQKDNAANPSNISTGDGFTTDAASSKFLLEAGDDILLEAGDFLILEAA